MEYREDGDEENGVEQAREAVSGRLARHSSKSCGELSGADGNWCGKGKKRLTQASTAYPPSPHLLPSLSKG